MDHQTERHFYFRDVLEVQKHWGWYLGLGFLLILLGMLAVGYSYQSTIISVIFLGCVLLAAGIAQLAQLFWSYTWQGTWLNVLLGVLYLITGFIFITKPALTAVTLTLLIAALCLVGGLFRMIASVIMRFDHWGWVFFNGLITFILGLMIYSEWPVSGLWVIGLFVGIDLILSGWIWTLLSMGARKAVK